MGAILYFGRMPKEEDGAMQHPQYEHRHSTDSALAMILQCTYAETA